MTGTAGSQFGVVSVEEPVLSVEKGFEELQAQYGSGGLDP